MSACRRAVAMLDTYADGELEPERVVEMEAHLADCNGCSSRLQLEHAMKKSLRRQVYAQSEPSEAFSERILASFQAEAEREAVGKLESSQRGAMLSWSSIVPLAAAAAIALFWSNHTTDPSNKPSNQGQRDNKQASILNVEQLLDQIVDRHIDRSKPEVTEPALLDGMEPEVGVPVHFPSLAQYGARWQGGRIVPLHNQTASANAASLKFLVDGHRVTVYVYNSERIALGSPLKRRVVGDEPVYTGWKRGYSIATADRHGVGYAVATDLGEDEGAEIVASLH